MSTPETFPTLEDSKVEIIEGKTMSKQGGWWSAILLVRIKEFNKVQVKWMLWQEKTSKSGQKEWAKKQTYTINPYNWPDFQKVTNEMLEKRKTIK